MSKSSDWLLTSSLLILLLALFIIAKVQSSYLDLSPSNSRSFVEVTVQGHVAKPGVYSCEIGMPISEILRKAKPKPFAVVHEEERVQGPCTIQVEKLSELVVSVSGAVDPVQELKVPIGTRISDLKKYLVLHPDADLKFFKKRRLLKNEEELHIPLDKKNL